MMTDAVKITIKNLSIAFGNTQVLKGVNLDIEPGELFSFLGPLAQVNPLCFVQLPDSDHALKEVL